MGRWSKLSDEQVNDILEWLRGIMLKIACQLTKRQFIVTPLVIEECQLTLAAELLELRIAGAVAALEDKEIPGDLFIQLLADLGLGEGETECLVVCLTNGDIDVCCDDGKARQTGKSLLGAGRVVGSMRVLRWCVEEELIDCEAAYASFVKMREGGGFLPEMNHDFFCAACG
jgi:predicted nucleic acid-binding protein